MNPFEHYLHFIYFENICRLWPAVRVINNLYITASESKCILGVNNDGCFSCGYKPTTATIDNASQIVTRNQLNSLLSFAIGFFSLLFCSIILALVGMRSNHICVCQNPLSLPISIDVIPVASVTQKNRPKSK